MALADSTPASSPSSEIPGSARPGSTEDLFAVLYRELHSLAGRHLHRKGVGFTLGTTTLLHELYLKIARSTAEFPDHLRFLGYASRAMRGLIVDYTRKRATSKRGGEFVLLPMGEQSPGNSEEELQHLEALSEALDHLSRVDPELAELVDLHFFCGLSFVEIAALRGVSDRTVQRDWHKARLLLHRELRP
ncbi:MAG TPA: ECF-type sigma factor [Gemmatimonadales bacterium]|jgi:RNA polymerase sigma factor (TIGR02999 family)